MISDFVGHVGFWTFPFIGICLFIGFLSLMGAHAEKPKKGEPAPPKTPEPQTKLEKRTGPILFDVDEDSRIDAGTILYGVTRLLAWAIFAAFFMGIFPEAFIAWYKGKDFTIDPGFLYLSLWVGTTGPISEDFFWWHSNKKPLGFFHVFWIQKNFLGGYPTEKAERDDAGLSEL